jgi:hypothetical protein
MDPTDPEPDGCIVMSSRSVARPPTPRATTGAHSVGDVSRVAEGSSPVADGVPTAEPLDVLWTRPAGSGPVAEADAGCLGP